MLDLTLPEPAFALYARTHDLLDRFLPNILPSGSVWAICGGAVLSALWGHRKSTHLDVFLPAGSGLSAVSPEWNPAFTKHMASRGATDVLVQTRGLKFQFESGRLELTVLDPVPPLDPTPVTIGGHARYIWPSACVLTGKLAGRGLRMPARDMFDLAVAVRESPDAAACAVNHLDPHTRMEISARLLANEDAYRADAAEAILAPDPRRQHLLEDAPRIAAEGLSDLVYRSVALEFDGARARLSVANAAQGEIEREFGSSKELLAGIAAMGLRPWAVARHGTIRRFLAAANREFAAGPRKREVGGTNASDERRQPRTR